MAKVAFEELKAQVAKVFASNGFNEENALQMADVLCMAEARGVYSHGIQMVPAYMRMVNEKIVTPNPDIKVVAESESTIKIDGDRGFGGIVVAKAVKLAAEKAKKSGSCSVAIANSPHYGAGAYYVQKAADLGQIGYLYANADKTASPFGGAGKYFGTNPYSFAAPAGKYKYVTLDMATTVTAWSKLYAAIQDGVKEVSPLMGVDRNGKPCTDPEEILYHGALSHFGGPKGYGIAFMIALVTGVLTGPKFLADDIECQGFRSGTATISSYLQVTDIAHFTPVEEYVRKMEEFVADLKSVKPAEGFKEVFFPGEMENRNLARALEEGVTIHDAAYNNFIEAAAELGVQF